MFLRPAVCAFSLIAFISHGYAQLAQLDSAAKVAARHGATVTADFYADVLVGRDMNQMVQSASFFFDCSLGYELGRIAPIFNRASLFTSLHVNHTLADSLSFPIQSASGIQADPGVRLTEIWAEESLNPNLTIRAGKIDANRDFAFIENGANFLNSSAGFTPAFPALPNYNNTRPGAEFLIHKNGTHLNLAVFSPMDGPGVLLIYEGGASWSPQGWKGRIAGGYWRKTGAAQVTDSDDHLRSQGVYLVTEQKLWRDSHSAHLTERSLSAYLQWGSSDSYLNVMPRQAAVGILWTAPFRSRPADTAGISCSRGQRADALEFRSAKAETAWEFFYRFQLSKFVSITPDFQYIAEPREVAGGRSIIASGARITFSLRPNSE